MPEPNPYESPQTEQPLKPRQVVKRGMGLAAILLLTPVAGGIAMAGSCAATDAAVNSLDLRRVHVAIVILVGGSVFLIPPIITLAGMLWWARRAYLRDAKGQKQTPVRTGVECCDGNG